MWALMERTTLLLHTLIDVNSRPRCMKRTTTWWMERTTLLLHTLIDVDSRPGCMKRTTTWWMESTTLLLHTLVDVKNRARCMKRTTPWFGEDHTVVALINWRQQSTMMNSHLERNGITFWKFPKAAKVTSFQDINGFHLWSPRGGRKEVKDVALKLWMVEDGGWGKVVKYYRSHIIFP